MADTEKPTTSPVSERAPAQPAGAKQSEEELAAHGEFLQRHQASLGRPTSDLESERILSQGPSAVGHGPQERDQTTPVTVNGPLDHRNPEFADKDLWKRSEREHIDRNNSEVGRASKASKQAGHGELIAVRSGLTGLHADRVAFSEVDPIHPHGYAYVAGKDSAPVIIAPTPAVQEALLFHRLVKVSGPMPKQLRDQLGGDDEGEEQAEPRKRARA